MPSRIRVQNELILRDRNVGIGSTLPASKLSITQSSSSQALDVGSQLKVDGSGVFNPSITIGSTVGAGFTQKLNITAVSRENGLLEFENFYGNQFFSASNDQSGDLFNVYRYYQTGSFPIPIFQNRKLFGVSNVGDVYIQNNLTNLGILSSYGTFRLGNVGSASTTFNEIHSSLALRPGFSTSITQSVYIVPKISDKGAISFETPIGTAQTDRGTQAFSISNNFDSYIFRVNDLNRNPILQANTNGRIGIGTTNPQARMEIVGTTRVSSVGSTAGEQIDIRHYRNIAGFGATIADNKGALSFDSPFGISIPGIGTFQSSLFAITNDPTGNVFSVAGYNAKRFTSDPRIPAIDIPQSGNVGIGTTNPTQKLQINSGSDIVVATTTGRIGISSSIPTEKLDINGNLRVNGLVRITSNNSSTNNEINLNHRFQSSGINSSYPVRGSVLFEGLLEQNLNGGQLISIINDNSSLFTVNRFVGLSSLSYAPAGQRNVESVIDFKLNGNIGIRTTNPIQPFQFGITNSSGVSTTGTIFVINSNVDVGIGTANPITKLDVRGNVNITGISTVGLGSTSSPSVNSTMSFELADNTTLRVRVRGSDGVVRTGIITLSN